MEVPLPPDPLETQDSEPGTALNSELETAFPSSRCPLPTALCPPDIPVESPGTGNPGPKPPPPYDETARRADELFLMTHGYPRNNPPKHIPNRRWQEDFRSQGIFGDPSKNIRLKSPSRRGGKRRFLRPLGKSCRLQSLQFPLLPGD